MRGQHVSGAAAAGAAGTPDAVHIIVGMDRHVEIEHMADCRNVEAARRDIAGDEDLEFAGTEFVQGSGAQRLVEIAMDRGGVEAMFDQALGHHVHVALAVAEHNGVVQRRLRLADQPAQRFAFGPVVGWNLHHFLGDVCGSGGGTRDFDAHRIVQELVGEALDFRRHGGGIKQRLAGEGQKLADLLHVRNEAHVQHAVGFIDHQDIDLGEQDAAALEMIHQPAGGGDQHIHAAIQFLDLIVHRDAANQQCMAELGIFAVFVEAFRDLVGQFAGRFQHQGARHACLGTAPGQHLDHGQGETGGLAGAGLGDADHIAPLQHMGDALRLDRRGNGVAAIGHRLEDLGGKAQRIETGLHRRAGGGLCHRSLIVSNNFV